MAPADRPDGTLDDVFRAGLTEQKYYAQRCADCGTTRWPVSAVCTACWSDAYVWVDLVGAIGTLHSFVIYRRAFHTSVVGDVPYAMGVATIDGARVLARVTGCQPEHLTIGATVRLVGHPGAAPNQAVTLEPAG